MTRRLAGSLVLLVATACTEVVYPPGTAPTPLSNATSPAPVASTRIEFRVTGNATGVRVRYSNAIDGLTQIVTTLPYTATISTTDTSMFLSLEATPTSYNALVVYPFLAVQIFANGILFREATSNEFLLSPLSVSGTWRK
jgi:hypothetical protein